MPGPLLIVGASVRAAAFSAIRAGFAPSGIDLFADRDLVAACPACRVEPSEYPDGLERAAGAMPPGPWIYTGALENHPDLVDRIARSRPLWGSRGAILRAVRDPIALAAVLRKAGLPHLAVRREASGVPRDGSWLIKPVRSAGGARIRPLDRASVAPVEGEEYLQRRAIGPGGSAIFSADGRSARLCGVTRQWVGHDGGPFGYLGSVGPVRVPAGVAAQLRRLGEVIAGAFGVRGLFGVDFVLSAGAAWPTEVNPRYTASVEVLEFATGRSLLREHARACGAIPEADGHDVCSGQRHGRVGKLVVFARRDGEVPRPSPWEPLDPRSGRLPPVADLPAEGTRFRAGQPVLTLLESGPTASACRARLVRRLRETRRLLRSRVRDRG